MRKDSTASIASSLSGPFTPFGLAKRDEPTTPIGTPQSQLIRRLLVNLTIDYGSHTTPNPFFCSVLLDAAIDRNLAESQLRHTAAAQTAPGTVATLDCAIDY